MLNCTVGQSLSVALATALYGTIGDASHAAARVLVYPSPLLFCVGTRTARRHLLAWWVPAEFAAGGFVFTVLWPRVLARLGGLLTRHSGTLLPSWSGIAGAVGLSQVLYVSSSVLNAFGVSDRWISLWLAAGTVIVWRLRAPTSRRVDIILTLASALTAVGGVLFESLLCHAGVFRYVRPDCGPLRVRHWIFWLWLSAILSGGMGVLKLAASSTV